MQQQQHLLNPTEWRSGESSQTREEPPHRWPACLKKQPPRVAFKNNDIYMINDEQSDPYEEAKERNMRVLYKCKVNKDPTFKNVPHEEEFDDDNYKSIEEKETAV